MALPAANIRIKSFAVRLCAVGLYFNQAPGKREGTFQVRFKNHVRARIVQHNLGHRTGFAQIRMPLAGFAAWVDQAAFFTVSSPVVIAIKIMAFFTSRCSHQDKLFRR
jgi:hypothetical protein